MRRPPARGCRPALAWAVVAACAPGTDVRAPGDAHETDVGPTDAPGTDSGPDSDGPTYVVDPSPDTLRGCDVFPADTVFHADVRTLPVHARSEAWLDRLGRERPLRVPAALDTTNPWLPVRYGVPVTLADAGTPRRDVVFDGFYPVDRQFPGPYPIPPGLDVQTGFDQQTVIVETDACEAYELIGYSDVLVPAANGGARWDLATHDLLPGGHAVTAPGWPILGTILRADEVARGRVDHVLAFTIPDVARDAEPLWPAVHGDGTGTGDDAVPMGAWLRLRADVDASAMPPAVRVVAEGLKVHGMLLGDSGGTADAVHLKLEKTDAWRGPDGEPADVVLSRIGEWLAIGDFEVVDAAPMRSAAGSLAIR